LVGFQEDHAATKIVIVMTVWSEVQ